MLQGQSSPVPGSFFCELFSPLIIPLNIFNMLGILEQTVPFPANPYFLLLFFLHFQLESLEFGLVLLFLA